MKRVNYHIHSHWSADSQLAMREAFVRCRELGIDEIAITDHVDFCCPYIDDIVCDIVASHAEIDALRPHFPELAIKKGVEIGLHRNNLVETAEYLSTLSPDFIIASVHSFQAHDAWNREALQNKSPVEIIRLYLEELRYVAERFETWSVLGHIDFPMRYHPISEGDLFSQKDLIDEILKIAVARNRGIEINLAGVGKIGRPHPAPWILERFLALGGTIVTMGTDAHSPEALDQGFMEGEALLRSFGIAEVSTFEQLVPRPIIRESKLVYKIPNYKR
jgi:histidinol-phosphatase (PHP family)